MERPVELPRSRLRHKIEGCDVGEVTGDSVLGTGALLSPKYICRRLSTATGLARGRLIRAAEA